MPNLLGDLMPASAIEVSWLCADSKFTQQELPACKPLLTPGIVSTTPSSLYLQSSSF